MSRLHPILARFLYLLNVFFDAFLVLGFEGAAVEVSPDASCSAHGREHLMILMGAAKFLEIIAQLLFLTGSERRPIKTDMQIHGELFHVVLHLRRLSVYR